MLWLGHFGLELIQSLKHLPGSVYDIIRSFGEKSGTYEDLSLNQIDCYFVESGEDISVFYTDLHALRGSNDAWVDNDFSFENIMKIMIIDSMPIFNIENSIEDSKVLSVVTIPDVKKELTLG
jgi:hypothetical protein